jgi:hypothetical protein
MQPAGVSPRAARITAEDAEFKSCKLTGFFLLSSVSSVVEFSFSDALLRPRQQATA